jgi:hypothetical protein
VGIYLAITAALDTEDVDALIAYPVWACNVIMAA